MSLADALATLRQSINRTLGTIDGKLRNKPDRSEVYTIADVDAALDTKADAATAITLAQLNTRLEELIGSAPETLDTFKEIADALGDDPNFATTITEALAKRATKTELKSLETSIGDAFTQLAQAFDAGADNITGNIGA